MRGINIDGIKFGDFTENAPIYQIKNLAKISRYNVIKKHGCTSCRAWEGSKWRPVLKVREQLQDKHSKVMQKSYRWKSLAILM